MIRIGIVVFKKKLICKKKKKKLTHDDGRRPVAIGPLSDSGDLKIVK